MAPKLDFLSPEKDTSRKEAKQAPTQCELIQFSTIVFAVAVATVVIIVYITTGHRSNDTGRITLRSTKILLGNKADLSHGPSITTFDSYEISPKYFEDLTSHECGDTTCYADQSCEQSDSSAEYVLVSDGGYCNSTDGREPITTPGECATAGAALNGSVLPGENRIFVHDCEENPSCVDITDYPQAGPCWITGTSGGLKFNENQVNGFSGWECGTVDEGGGAPSACVCKQTEPPHSYCAVAQCQPDNMTEFFTQVLIQHYGLNNVENLHVSDDDGFSYEFEGHSFFGSRSDILHCDGQMERLAVSRACQCENGLASLFCDEQSHGCDLCSSGFYMNDDASCSPNQCICPVDNGIPATAADCPDDGAVKCMGCNTSFRLENEACVPNTCFCNNGTAVTGAQCTQDGAEICFGCNTGFRLENEACVPNTCFCNNGTAVTGAQCTQNGMFTCASCVEGFNMRVDGTCVLNECDCSNGQGATGANCPVDGTTKCASCDSGFTLVDGTCSPNQCICPVDNGIPATAADCPDDGAVKCMGCEDGFRLENETCVPNTCFCNNGTAATGDKCTENDAEICTGCVSDFSLNDDGICSPNQCICPNGQGATGANCPVHGATKCVSCNAGWHIEGSVCFINKCICGNGYGAEGTSCPVDGQNKCGGCDGCYYLDDGSCVSRLLCWEAFCHPSDATVVVQHACDTGLCLARRRMDELNIGDTVESEVGIFEPVLAFLHRDGDAKGEFLSFEFVNNSMEISGNHYMYANGMRVLPGTVKIGDVLSNGETITGINQVSKAGMFHPITLSTKLMVNGVQVSTNFEWGGIDVSYIENIFGWVAKAIYTIGMPIDVAEDTLWAPLMTVRDNWSSGSQQILNYLPKTLHPVGIVFGGLMLLVYVFPQTALFALITMATFKIKKKIN